MGAVTAKPADGDGRLRLQLKRLTGLGLPMPRDGLQSAVDSFFATKMKEGLPAGLRVDNVEVTNTGVATQFSARNLSIQASGLDACAPGQH
jgi:hypothetical protein